MNSKNIIHLDFGDDFVFYKDDLYVEKSDERIIELIGKYPLINIIYEEFDTTKYPDDFKDYLEYLEQFKDFNVLHINKKTTVESIQKVLSIFNKIEYIEYKGEIDKDHINSFPNWNIDLRFENSS